MKSLQNLLSVTRRFAFQRRNFTSLASWPVRELRIPVPHGHLAAKEWGPPNGIPVLALHGWQDNCNTFNTLTTVLEPKFKLVALDFSGHGFSSHLPKGTYYSHLQFVLDIQRTVDYLQWEEFTLFGHSMGGSVAHFYSVIFPNRVKHLVQIDNIVPEFTLPDRIAEIFQRQALEFIRLDNKINKPPSYTEEEVIERSMNAIPGAYTPDAIRILMTRGCTPIGKNQFVFNRDLRLKAVFPSGINPGTFQYLIPRYKNEMLVIKAIPGLMAMDNLREEMRELCGKSCSRFKYVEVEGLHHVHLIDPEKVAEHINEFVSE